MPWGEFDQLVAVHQAGSRVRRLPTKSQFVALLYGQLAGAASLRDIVTGLQKPSGAAVPHGRAPGAPLDLGGCQCAPPP